MQLSAREQWRNTGLLDQELPARKATEECDASERWFALQVKPRHEKVVAELLTQKGTAAFLPLHTSARRWSDRVQSLELPLFPSYVFARFDPQQKLPVVTTPGVTRIVGVGLKPAPIEDAEIAGIERAVSSGLKCEPVPSLAAGDSIVIVSGPLKGTEGVLVNSRNRAKFVIKVSLLQRAVAVEIDPAWVMAASHPPMTAGAAAGQGICQ